MKTQVVILVLNCFILIKVSEGHVVQIARIIPSPGPMPRPTPPPQPTLQSAPQPTQQPAPQSTPQPTSQPTPTTVQPTLTAPPPFDRVTPKCYPETAKAYFLPAPPSSPIVTVLDHNVKDLPSTIQYSLKEMPSNQELASNIIANRPSFVPPPASPSSTVLPDLIDEIPTIVQERFSRVTESEGKVCDACANMISKLPIFKFDQELLDGFLVGLGL